MNKVLDLKFEKVSYEQFEKDCIKLNIKGDLRSIYEAIKLPKRATKGSAGYDFYSPLPFKLGNGCISNYFAPLLSKTTITIPTGVRCKMPESIVLMLFPRSGYGFKTGTTLANTVGIIDSDYYYSDNEGHIMLKLVEGFDTLDIKQGQGIMQGIFTQYFATEDDDVEEIRNGGFGSTTKE
jgi:dUTP pyrophosphatase